MLLSRDILSIIRRFVWKYRIAKNHKKYHTCVNFNDILEYIKYDDYCISPYNYRFWNNGLWSCRNIYNLHAFYYAPVALLPKNY